EKALTEEALTELREDFEDALTNGVKSDDAVSFRRAGREIIRAGVGEFRELSGSLYSPLESERLHRLRIAAKRLRYAAELFSVCWEEGALAPFAKEIARMQGSLGQLHDSDVWMEELSGHLGRAEQEDAALPEMRRAAFWLLDYFVRERTRHFQHALDRWREWEETGFLSRLSDSMNAD
ncbi:MAG TPA: CHAD domain-containing protein, partial [Pyrinomonadaceae bacterium]|nr:CHAD domain-containing protein [Pyrinomonadaceae bacterium]